MNAGYLLGQWVLNKLQSHGQSYVVSALAASVGRATALMIVKKVVSVGVSSAATYIAGIAGINTAFTGPLGAIVGFATGWL